MPPPVPAELPLRVLCVTVNVALVLKMPPPLPPDELPLMVLLVTASVAPELLLMPPPLSLPTRLAELLMMLLRSVRPPSLRMPPPPLPVASNPLVTVKPEMVTVEPKFSNTRNVALPLTARLGAPGPEMVILWLTVSSPVVRVIVPVTAKVIVSPSFAMLSACRNDPGPLSLVFVTVMVMAYAGPAAMISSAAAMAAELVNGVNLFFIFIVRVQWQSPESGRKRDIYFAFFSETCLECPARGVARSFPTSGPCAGT